MRGGDFSGTGTPIYDPASGNSTGAGKTAFAGNKIPAGRIAPAALIMLQIFRRQIQVELEPS
jgi:hypothetical protein